MNGRQSTSTDLSNEKENNSRIGWSSETKEFRSPHSYPTLPYRTYLLTYVKHELFVLQKKKLQRDTTKGHPSPSPLRCVRSARERPIKIMSTAAPRPFLLDELDDHLDPDLDEDLRRMSFETMNALDSLTDEVDAMEQKVESASKQPKMKVRSSSFGEEDGGEVLGDGRRDASISEQQGQKESRTLSLRHIDDVVLSEGEDDDDGMSLDGSIARELDDLRMVAQEIEKELQFQDSGTMEEAMASLQNPVVDDDPTRRILTSDDHEIIRRVLYDDMKNYEPKNSWEHFMKRYHLEGFRDRDKTYGLSALCTVVWSIVIFLVAQVKYGEML